MTVAIPSLLMILAIIAFIVTVIAMVGKAPITVPVLLLCLIELIEKMPGAIK